MSLRLQISGTRAALTNTNEFTSIYLDTTLFSKNHSHTHTHPTRLAEPIYERIFTHFPRYQTDKM